jgi:hypothetical protein
MIRHALLIAPLALLCVAAAPAPKAPPAKSAAKPVAAKPAPPKPVSTAVAKGSFDIQNPQGLMDILGQAGAKVQTRARDGDSVFVAVTSTTANFSMQFAGCNPQGRACRAVLLDAAMERSSVTGAQINAFNQTSVMCRIYQDRAATQHVVYSAMLFQTMNRDDAATHLQAWQGCLADAHDFLKDPVGYLANAA